MKQRPVSFPAHNKCRDIHAQTTKPNAMANMMTPFIPLRFELKAFTPSTGSTLLRKSRITPLDMTQTESLLPLSRNDLAAPAMKVQ
jgi:hypothetical protein